MTRMADVGGCCSQTEAVTSARLLESLCHSHASGIVFNFLFVQMRVCVGGGSTRRDCGFQEQCGTSRAGFMLIGIAAPYPWHRCHNGQAVPTTWSRAIRGCATS